MLSPTALSLTQAMILTSVGIEALDFAINFDITNFDWVDGSLTSDYNWSMDLLTKLKPLAALSGGLH